MASPTVLFPSVGAVECAFQQRIDSALRERVDGVESTYLTLNERARRQFGHNRPIENVRTEVQNHSVSTEAASDIRSYFLDETSDRETARVRGCVEADRTTGSRESDFEDLFLRYFDVVERYLLDWDVDFVFMDFGAELFRTALIEAAKRHGVPFVYPKYVPLPDQSRFGLLDRISNVQPALDGFRDDELNKNDRQLVRRAERTFTDTDSLFGPARSPSVTTGKVAGFVKTLAHDLRYEKFQNPYYSTYRATRRNLAMIVRKHLMSRFRSEPDLQERYVFFPLHSPDDAQLTMRAPQYTDQAGLAATVAKSLPPGWTLYVKEHPAFVGGYELRNVDRLASADNVKLVPPTLNARRLAAAADTVVVINSKVGLESLYLDTPVVVLGDPFYSRKGLTTDVTDLGELPTVLRTQIQRDDSTADPETLGKLLCRLRDESYPGRVLRRSNPETQTRENADRYADALHTELIDRGVLS